MAETTEAPDPLLLACDALLREVAGDPLTARRLPAAMPVIRGILSEIRRLDEIDLEGVEPATSSFRPAGLR